MPNGKGQLDCSYCLYFDGSGYPDGFGEERTCYFHHVILPMAHDLRHNRVCCHFEPNEAFERHGGIGPFSTVAGNFAKFGHPMEPGVLYEFPYPNPSAIEESALLRVPNSRNDS